MKNLGVFLKQDIIRGSSPARIDFGGIWDAKAAALPFHDEDPVTFNIALNLRIYVEVSAFEKGYIKIDSKGYSSEVHSYETMELQSKMGLILAICRYFKIAGVCIKIYSDFPHQSGLGGSGALAVTLIYVLNSLLAKCQENERLGMEEIVKLAHDLEDGLRFSITGLQDQAAAAYGGVNLWHWDYQKLPMIKRKLLYREEQILEIEKRILIVYTGKTHNSDQVNQKSFDSLFSGRNNQFWIKLNALTKQFALSINELDWQLAKSTMEEELALRRELNSDLITESAELFIEEALAASCGVRFAGAGAGGCIWALGDIEEITKLESKWRVLCDEIDGSKLLNTDISRIGSRID